MQLQRRARDVFHLGRHHEIAQMPQFHRRKAVCMLVLLRQENIVFLKRALPVEPPGAGRRSTPLEGHTSAVSALAVTPDGRRALSGSEDRTLRLWDLESGNEIATFTGENGM